LRGVGKHLVVAQFDARTDVFSTTTPAIGLFKLSLVQVRGRAVKREPFAVRSFPSARAPAPLPRPVNLFPVPRVLAEFAQTRHGAFRQAKSVAVRRASACAWPKSATRSRRVARPLDALACFDVNLRHAPARV